MGVEVVTQIVIARPVDQVAAYATDPGNAPTWYVNIESVEWVTEPPVRVGSLVTFVAHFLRRRLEYTYEFVELVPSVRLVMSTKNGPFPMETTYTWTALSTTSTRMTMRNRGTPTGFSKLVAPFMSMAIRRATRKDLAKLKEILEAT